MARYRVMKDDGFSRPLEILFEGLTSETTDEEIDEALPLNCKREGVLVFDEAISIVKMRDFDGAWNTIYEEESE